jgi:hypothetical protein
MQWKKPCARSIPTFQQERPPRLSFDCFPKLVKKKRKQRPQGSIPSPTQLLISTWSTNPSCSKRSPYGISRICRRPKASCRHQVLVKFHMILPNRVMTNAPLESLFRNYALNFNRSSKAGCRTGIDFILNECLTVMVSWLDSLVTLFNHKTLRKVACLGRKLSPPRAAYRSLGLTSKSMARYHSPTRSYHPLQRSRSMAALIMASVLSFPVPRLLNGASTHSSSP